MSSQKHDPSKRVRKYRNRIAQMMFEERDGEYRPKVIDTGKRRHQKLRVYDAYLIESENDNAQD